MIKEKYIRYVICFLSLVIVNTSQAELIDRGGGLIYDTILDITWLQDANYAKTTGFDSNGSMQWGTANSWADSLVYYDSARDVYWNDWRLPMADLCTGYNCTNSEMGHLYYVSLGNSAFTNWPSSSPPPLNSGPFSNVIHGPGQEYWYQNATRSGPNAGLKGTFSYFVGIQGDSYPAINFAMLVRDGDVAAIVPEPISSILFVTGGSLLAGRRYIKRKKKA